MVKALASVMEPSKWGRVLGLDGRMEAIGDPCAALSPLPGAPKPHCDPAQGAQPCLQPRLLQTEPGPPLTGRPKGARFGRVDTCFAPGQPSDRSPEILNTGGVPRDLAPEPQSAWGHGQRVRPVPWGAQSKQGTCGTDEGPPAQASMWTHSTASAVRVGGQRGQDEAPGGAEPLIQGEKPRLGAAVGAMDLRSPVTPGPASSQVAIPPLPAVGRG